MLDAQVTMSNLIVPSLPPAAESDSTLGAGTSSHVDELELSLSQEDAVVVENKNDHVETSKDVVEFNNMNVCQSKPRSIHDVSNNPPVQHELKNQIISPTSSKKAAMFGCAFAQFCNNL